MRLGSDGDFEKKQSVEIWGWTSGLIFEPGRGQSSYGLRDARALLEKSV